MMLPFRAEEQHPSSVPALRCGLLPSLATTSNAFSAPLLLQEGKKRMDHFTTRLGPGGVQRLSSNSRFCQVDAHPLPRVELICPQPRRPPILFQSPLNRPNSPKPNGVYRADSASDVLDLILNKSDRDADIDSSSKAAFFCGSPPVRTNNPVVHDPMFGEKTPSFSPLLGGSFGKKLAGRLEVGSPSCGASSPKVRIEGFACGNKESHCAVA